MQYYGHKRITELIHYILQTLPGKDKICIHHKIPKNKLYVLCSNRYRILDTLNSHLNMTPSHNVNN